MALHKIKSIHIEWNPPHLLSDAFLYINFDPCDSGKMNSGRKNTKKYVVGFKGSFNRLSGIETFTAINRHSVNLQIKAHICSTDLFSFGLS